MFKTTKTQHILVSGIVQGVGFRYNLKSQATHHQVTGWCRNLKDGRVEAVIQGYPKDIEAILDWCQQGPTEGRVDEVQITEFESVENYPIFEIRGTI